MAEKPNQEANSQSSKLDENKLQKLYFWHTAGSHAKLSHTAWPLLTQHHLYYGTKNWIKKD